MASNQVDKFGKILSEESPDYIYKYNGHVPFGILGMIDDVVGVSESGIKAKQLNAYINVKFAEKIFRLLESKKTYGSPYKPKS